MATHIGLIGGGNISETHARAVRAITDVQIAAVFGSNAENVNRLCREYGGTPYTDFEKFLAHRPMEVAAIGSPSGLHAEQGMATDTPSFTPALRASAMKASALCRLMSSGCGNAGAADFSGCPCEVV